MNDASRLNQAWGLCCTHTRDVDLAVIRRLGGTDLISVSDVSCVRGPGVHTAGAGARGGTWS